MTMPLQPVSAFLAASPHARRGAALDLGFGRSTTVWSNRDARIRYEGLSGHTLSLYTQGGGGTRRIDAGARASGPARGWQGAICLMPQGQSSEWEISERFEFFHLHLPDEELRLAYSEICGRDARGLELAERTYIDAPQMLAPFRCLLAATRAGDPLAAETATAELLASLFAGSLCRAAAGAMSGGLAPHKLRLVTDYIAAHLDQRIQLRDLARLAGLSDFHLQRSFRASTGVSPHRWILHRRIESAKIRLRAGQPLVAVALDCGFDSHSHFSRAFKAATGTTPGQYRSLST